LDEIVAVLGPTASGKSDLALALAKKLGGEVISADSRQVYRHLDAGTAKPGYPCRLVDVAEPSERFDAGRFAELARAAIAEVRAAGRVPILCGGTGLYVRALREGLAPLPRRDDALRARLAREAETAGRPALHARLRSVDPDAAAAIPPNNIQRVVRALEVFELTGRPITAHWKAASQAAPRERWTTYVIDLPAEELRRRIEERARRMWPAMLEEAARLVPARFTGREPGFESLGYPQALAVLRGELSPAAGLEAMIAATNAYAKRQRTWFRNQCEDAVVLPAGVLA
jgi:tRNA dimethylallyltransferase